MVFPTLQCASRFIFNQRFNMIKKIIQIGFISLFATLPALAANDAGDASAGRAKTEVCSGCHGEDGNAAAPIFPKLAGQHVSYLEKQLKAFRSRERVDPTMNAMTQSLSDTDIGNIATYYNHQKITPENRGQDHLGEKIYRAGNTVNGVPSCVGCHGPTGAGNPASGYPVLHGQFSAYISKTLLDYKNGDRSNDANQVMRSIASRLTEAEINAVANYASGLYQ
jgi:cytochrome c553